MKILKRVKYQQVHLDTCDAGCQYDGEDYEEDEEYDEDASDSPSSEYDIQDIVMSEVEMPMASNSTQTNLEEWTRTVQRSMMLGASGAHGGAVVGNSHGLIMGPSQTASSSSMAQDMASLEKLREVRAPTPATLTANLLHSCES